MIKSCKIYACPNGLLGLHLTRAPWDPYPWISGIQKDSSAAQSGMRMGDTVLEINDCDVLGQRIIEIAERVRQHWQSGASFVKIVIWRNNIEDTEHDDEFTPNNDKGKAHINQQSLQKFATCLQQISQLLECPVCLEISRPPSWQCCNGHVICNNCRSRSEKCPVCRVPLGPRGRCLLADKLFRLLAENFSHDSGRSNNKSLKERRKSASEFCNQTTAATTTINSLPEAEQTKENSKKIDRGKIMQKFISKRRLSQLQTMTTTTTATATTLTNNCYNVQEQQQH